MGKKPFLFNRERAEIANIECCRQLLGPDGQYNGVWDCRAFFCTGHLEKDRSMNGEPSAKRSKADDAEIDVFVQLQGALEKTPGILYGSWLLPLPDALHGRNREIDAIFLTKEYGFVACEVKSASGTGKSCAKDVLQKAALQLDKVKEHFPPFIVKHHVGEWQKFISKDEVDLFLLNGCHHIVAIPWANPEKVCDCDACINDTEYSSPVSCAKKGDFADKETTVKWLEEHVGRLKEPLSDRMYQFLLMCILIGPFYADVYPKFTCIGGAFRNRYMKNWFTLLTEEQKKSIGGTKLQLILGTAGTGKTTIMMYRVINDLRLIAQQKLTGKLIVIAQNRPVSSHIANYLLWVCKELKLKFQCSSSLVNIADLTFTSDDAKSQVYFYTYHGLMTHICDKLSEPCEWTSLSVKEKRQIIKKLSAKSKHEWLSYLNHEGLFSSEYIFIDEAQDYEGKFIEMFQNLFPKWQNMLIFGDENDQYLERKVNNSALKSYTADANKFPGSIWHLNTIFRQTCQLNNFSSLFKVDTKELRMAGGYGPQVVIRPSLRTSGSKAKWIEGRKTNTLRSPVASAKAVAAEIERIRRAFANDPYNLAQRELKKATSVFNSFHTALHDKTTKNKGAEKLPKELLPCHFMVITETEQVAQDLRQALHSLGYKCTSAESSYKGFFEQYDFDNKVIVVDSTKRVKGMEAPYTIVFDPKQSFGEKRHQIAMARSQLYVSTSRATIGMTILTDKEGEKVLLGGGPRKDYVPILSSKKKKQESQGQQVESLEVPCFDDFYANPNASRSPSLGQKRPLPASDL